MAEEFMSGNNDDFFKSWTSTQVKLIKHRHTWAINDFSFYGEKSGECILSPPFTAGINEKLEWRLELYPKGDITEHSNYVSVFLHLLTPHPQGIQAKYKLCIVNTKGENVNIKTESSRFKENGWGFSRFVKHEALFNKRNDLLLDDKLTLVCQIIAAMGSGHISGTLTKAPSRGIDVSSLFLNKDYSDVTLSASGKEFPAHRLVLGCRSSVFRVMLQDNTANKNYRIEISDLGEEALREMLRYMYTGQVNQLEKMAPTMLSVAEKYAMADLKVICEKALFKSLSLRNVTQIFILSHQFGITKLQDQVKEFITLHCEVLVNSPEFQSMVRTYPHLAVEVFLPFKSDSTDDGTT